MPLFPYFLEASGVYQIRKKIKIEQKYEYTI